MGWPRAQLLTAVTLLVLAAPGSALAADDATPLRIQYDVPPGCPDALAFFMYVRARTQRVRLAEPGELATLSAVHVDAQPGHATGTLELPTPDGPPFSRQVEAVSCDEVTLALSLVLALFYDPDAITRFEVAPEVPPPAGPPPLPPSAAPEPARSEIPGGRFAAGLGGFFMGGFAPNLSPGGAAFLEYGAPARAPWRPRAAAMVFMTPEVRVQVGSRSATLALYAGRLEACPAELRAAKRFSLSPCAAVDLGALVGAGATGVTPSTTRTRLWAAVSALLVARFEFAAPFFLDGYGGGGAPLVRDAFQLRGPTETVHHVPPSFGHFGIDVGAFFP